MWRVKTPPQIVEKRKGKPVSLEQKEALLQLARNTEEKIFAARILDYIQAVVKGKKPHIRTSFLNPGQVELLSEICRAKGETKILLWGGYQQAERRRALILPKSKQWYKADYQIEFLQVVPCKKNEAPGHQDYLGSILGLGINRDKIGDIIKQEQGAVIFVTREIISFLSRDLVKVGRCSIQTRILPEAEFVFSEPEIMEKVITVASARLDALLSKAFNLPRAESVTLIRQGKVFQNWRQQVHSSQPVKAGDMISCRGYGRFRIMHCAGTTKKGREKIILGFET